MSPRTTKTVARRLAQAMWSATRSKDWKTDREASGLMKTIGVAHAALSLGKLHSLGDTCENWYRETVGEEVAI